MKSIRAHLVLWLVAALAAGSALVAFLTYTYAHQELDRVFDDELRQIAEAVHLREDWKDTGMVRVARPDFLYVVRAYDATPEWLSKAIGYGLPVFEFSIGVLLIVGVAVRMAAIFSALLFLIFLIVGLSAAKRIVD